MERELQEETLENLRLMLAKVLLPEVPTDSEQAAILRRQKAVKSAAAAEKRQQQLKKAPATTSAPENEENLSSPVASSDNLITITSGQKTNDSIPVIKKISDDELQTWVFNQNSIIMENYSFQKVNYEKTQKKLQQRLKTRKKNLNSIF